MASRKHLMAAAITAAVALTACSDITAPREIAPAGQPVAANVRPAGSVVAASQASPTAGSAEGSRKCEASPAAAAGALNMLNDPTMFSIPMTRDAPQGNAGMFGAVAVSGC
jgi:hypothetical protein